MKENTPNKTPIITLEVIAQRKAEKLEEVQQAKKEMVQTIHELFAPVEHKGGVEALCNISIQESPFMTEYGPVSRSCKESEDIS